MGRQKATVKINQFIGGLNTEANPLNFPDGVTFSEQNSEIMRDGSRRRRDGFDLDVGSVSVNTGVLLQEGRLIARNQFRWDNPGGESNKQFLVVQVGNYMGIHDISSGDTPGPVLYSKTFLDKSYDKPLGFTVIDGVLVVASKQATIYTFTYADGVITEDSGKLLVRDFWGVEDTYGNVDLSSPMGISLRPNSLTDAHIYNLRNQTFSTPKVSGNDDTVTLVDPIDLFATKAAALSSGSFWGSYWATIFPSSGANPHPLTQLYPSNADNVVRFFYPDANLASNRIVERFNAESMLQTPPGSSKAPSGYFVIDSLDRGASRLAQIASLYSTNTALAHPISTLPEDKTPNGASVLSSYAGRVWYAGFSGGIVNGDNNSPRMSSYVLFSQIVENPQQIFNCYQEADPTSNEDSALVDTDGGFIRLDGAYGIKSLKTIESSLFVFAENGVWRISGSDANSFTPTAFSVSKISDEGCINGLSVITTDLAILYWGHNGIFACVRSEIGDWVSNSISDQSIQSFYKNITVDEKQYSIASYDSFDNTVRWLYGFQGGNESSKELILNVKFKAFTHNIISNKSAGLGVLSVSMGQRTSSVSAPQTVYCVMVGTEPKLQYGFGKYNATTLTNDWQSAGGVDSPCFLITGSITGGESRVNKGVPYLNTYFKITDGDEFNGVDSSCLVSAQWNWTTNSVTGKFSSPRQAYRPFRTGLGETILHTRNKIRGSGNSVAFKFESEPNKTFQIYGWEFNINANADE